MTNTTSTSRVQKLREARRDAGLVRVELYVPRDRAQEVRDKVSEILAEAASRAIRAALSQIKGDKTNG